MISILFVCHGNICRSPMAEFIMKDLVAREGLSENFFIASAATSSEEIYKGVGNPVYPSAKRMLSSHGIDCSGKRAELLKRSDYDQYDYLLGMDKNNIRNMLEILRGDPERKIYKLLSFTEAEHDIIDPWYSGDFETTYQDLVRGCEAFLAYLREKGAL